MPLQELGPFTQRLSHPPCKKKKKKKYEQGQVQALGGWRDCGESKAQGREEAQLGAEGSPTPSSAPLFSLFFPGPQDGETDLGVPTLALVGKPSHPPRAPGLAPSQP